MGPTASADVNMIAKLMSLHRIGYQFSSHPGHPIHYSDWATPSPPPTKCDLHKFTIYVWNISYILKTFVFSLTILHI